MSDITAVYYDKSHEKEWDDFIEHQACNGTWLQSRHFLNYHPEDKYKDCSLLFYRNNKLVGLCPACIVTEDGKRVFFSHMGSTYGGIIINDEMLRAERMLALIDSFENAMREMNVTECVLKQNNSLMNTHPVGLLDFCLYLRGYTEYKELDLYIDFDSYNRKDVISNFAKLKKRQVRKCIEAGIALRELTGRQDMEDFIRILADNLKKYNKTPYHTPNDLLVLKERFPDHIQYWGAIYENRIVAESMVFLFDKPGCVHTHYLAADPEYVKLSPMSYIYYRMIDIYINGGFQYLSWGITSEHFGTELNYNLTNNKEEYGSRHNVVCVYKKTF